MSKLSGSKSGSKNYLTPVLLLLATIFVVVVLFSASGVLNNFSEQRIIVTSDTASDIKTISVSGSSTKLVTPNKVEIILSVETLNFLVKDSQSENAKVSEEVRNALLKAGVTKEQIKTISYNVREEFEWNDSLKKSESIGYKTINQIQITLSDTKKAGEIIDTAISAGANKVSSLSFGLTKEKELEVKRNALSEASGEAKSKATSIAQGLGINLGKVYSVSENSNYYYPISYRDYDYALTTSAGIEKSTTPISEGEIEVMVQVEVQFEIN